MKDRYSLAVGLLFLAVIVVATIQTLNGGGAGGRSASTGSRPAGRCPSSPCPPPPAPLEGDANVAQDDCESSALPCPEDARRTPACRIATAGAIRVCDFFDRPLVISFWFTKGAATAPTSRTSSDAVYGRYRGRVNFLSLDVRDDRDTVRELVRAARLADAGRLRPRRRRRQPLPGRRLPDLRLRLPRRHPGERQHRRPHRRRARAPGSSACSTPAGRRKRQLMSARRRRAADRLGAGAGAGLGGAPRRRRVPRPRDRLGRGRRPARAAAPSRCAAACATSPTASTAPRRSTCANGRSPGPTASSSARSASTPTAPARRSSSWPSTASTTAASGAAACPPTRSTIAIVETGVALRAFDADRLEGRLCIRDSAAGESLPGSPGELAPGTLIVADERRPVGAALRRDRRGLRGRAAQPPPRDRRGPGQAVSRRSLLTRRYGWRRATLAVIYTRTRPMPDLLVRESSDRRFRVEVDERLARAELRRQIGRLERELASLLCRGLRPGRRSSTASPRSRPSRGSSTSVSWSGCATSSPTASPTLA